jgi:hypothetical protein
MASFSKTKYTTQAMQNWGFDDVYKVPTVEIVGFDGQTLQRLNATNMAMQIERDGQGNPIYLGIASPGTATSSALWQIRKLTFDGNNNVTAIQYADGTPSFTKEWDLRTTGGYNYI